MPARREKLSDEALILLALYRRIVEGADHVLGADTIGAYSVFLFGCRIDEKRLDAELRLLEKKRRVAEVMPGSWAITEKGTAFLKRQVIPALQRKYKSLFIQPR